MLPSQPNIMDVGKYIQPRMASLCLADVVGTTNCIYTRMEADDDDYEEFNEQHGYYPSHLHKMKLKVFNRAYVSVATNKKDAKERCAEKAFPDVLAVQVDAQKARPKQMDPLNKAAPFDHMEDEIPFASLCAMAMHKLYSDWQEDGFDIPEHLLEFRGSGKILADQKPSPAPSDGRSRQQQSWEGRQGGQRQQGGGQNMSNLNFKYVDFQGPPGSSQAQVSCSS